MSRADFMKGGSPELLSRGKTAIPVNSGKLFTEELAAGTNRNFSAERFMDMDLASGKTGEQNSLFAAKVVELADREVKNANLLKAIEIGRQR